MTPEKKRSKLRQILNGDKPLLIPGVGDPLGARLVQSAGFDAVYMSGYAVGGTCGFPDLGLLGMSEMVQRAESIASVLDIPLICDCDTGYGNVTNVIRTVREFERAGAAAIQLEDQSLPKKCGSMAGKGVVESQEMVGKIRAALDTRHDQNMMVIARTDALASEGVDRAIERLHSYAEAGADLLMVLGPYSVDDLKRLVKSVRKPLVHMNSESGTMPSIPTSELESMGIKIVVLPTALLLSSTRAMQNTLGHIKIHGTTTEISQNSMVSWSSFNELMGLTEMITNENRYSG